MALPPGLWSTRDASDLVSDTQGEAGLKRSVGPVGLTAMGVGAIIGTGIFVVIGEGAVTAGPAVIFSFVLAAVTCLFSALSYAELAAAVPVAGSAYTYSYATMGELVAASSTSPRSSSSCSSRSCWCAGRARAPGST
ncbi:MAG: basic amino acid/polyamine antiporter, family [Nocardioidaceae bacterium]|jgi:APA family basic amino acid/polyamine antiporter|nr:basic amino acid/polyamine antiporter, family [Nocardioidaceae bacterium]